MTDASSRLSLSLGPSGVLQGTLLAANRWRAAAADVAGSASAGRCNDVSRYVCREVRTRTIGTSLDQRFPLAADHAHSERFQAVGIILLHNHSCRQHGIVGTDVGCILRGLCDGVHLVLAARMVERADDDRLPEEDVFC